MLNCEICGAVTDIEPIYCCNGRDCGCMGMPVNENVLCYDCMEAEEEEND